MKEYLDNLQLLKLMNRKWKIERNAFHVPVKFISREDSSNWLFITAGNTPVEQLPDTSPQIVS